MAIHATVIQAGQVLLVVDLDLTGVAATKEVTVPLATIVETLATAIIVMVLTEVEAIVVIILAIVTVTTEI